MKSSQRCGRPFEIAHQPSEASCPAETTLDHPALGQEHKPFLGLIYFDHDQVNAHFLRRISGLVAGVSLVDKCYFDMVRQ